MVRRESIDDIGVVGRDRRKTQRRDTGQAQAQTDLQIAFYDGSTSVDFMPERY
jgi:hypothetical protein